MSRKDVGYRIFFPKFDRATQFERALLPGNTRGILDGREMWVMGLVRKVSGAGVLVLLAVGLFAQAHKQAASDAPNRFDSLLHQGFELHQKQDYAHSLPLLERARKLQPQNYFVNLLLGMDLLRTGKPADALAPLRIASRARPKEDFPHGYLGEAYARMGRYAEAVSEYQRAVDLAPDSPQASIAFVDFSVARFSTLSGRLRASRSGLAAEYRIEAMAHPLTDPQRRNLLQRSVELDGDAPGVWSDLSLAEIAAGDTHAAEQDLERSRECDPNDLRGWEAEALLAARKNDWNSATERLNAMARRSPGALAQALGDWPPALEPQKRISAAAGIFLECAHARGGDCTAQVLLARLPAPEGPGKSPSLLFREQRWEQIAKLPAPAASEKSGWFQRGTALAHGGRCDDALAPLERGLGNPSTNVHNSYLLALCYARQAGIVADRLARSGKRQDAAVHMMRGDVLLRLQANHAAALEEYKAALEVHPNDPAVLERIGEAQLRSGQMEAARDSALAALKVDSHQVGSKRTLAKIAMDQRDYASALPYLRELVEQDPQDVTARVELGTVCAQTGALDEALRRLGPALAAGYPDQKGSLHYLLGTVLRKMGRADDAERAFAAARELSDEFQQTSHQDQNEQP